MIFSSTAMPLKAILFDLDGTLINTMQFFADAAATVLERHIGMSFEDARAAYLASSGIPFRLQVKRMSPCPDETVALADQEFEKLKRGMVAIPMDQKTEQMLKRFKSQGIGIAISSNSYQINVDDFVKRSPLEFDFALGFSPPSFCKGEPHIQFALDYYGCRRSELLFVGDSLHDVAIARQSNVSAVGVEGTFCEAEFQRIFGDILCIRHVYFLQDVINCEG